MTLRLLVVEANTREARVRQQQALGVTLGDSYAAVLRGLAPDAVCDMMCASDDGATLPAALTDYDGVVWTGSSLHLWQRDVAVERQLELARAVFRSGVPFFGSCFGLQVAGLVAGGDVQKNPMGREIPIARGITPNAAGQLHPLLAGRAAVFDAPCSHLDIITTLPPDITVLASNAIAAVQAAEIRYEGGVFWGAQYHPEFDLRLVALIMRGHLDVLATEGIVPSVAAGEAVVADLMAGDAGRFGSDLLDQALRSIEISNWIGSQVRPRQSLRGRT